jgi:hypothetical protein
MCAIECSENRLQKLTLRRGEGTQSEAEGHGKIKGSGYTACNSLSQHSLRLDTKILSGYRFAQPCDRAEIFL